jgi:type IV pilus assembly protein PilV
MSKHPQSGSVLLEALISILIFAFGVLGLFGMQAVAMKNMSQSNYRATAVYMASQLIGRAQGDINHLADYQYTSGTANGKVDPWMAEVTAALPAAGATVAVDTVNSTLTVTVSWTAPGDPVSHQHTVSSYVSY